jgi:hypothetical protein
MTHKPVKADIDKNKEVSQHRHDVTELDPSELVFGIIVIIVFQFTDRLSVGFIEINDIRDGLYQEYGQRHNAYYPEEDPVV